VVNSRAKGARAERDLCHALKETLGWDARRSQQFCGNAGDADLIVDQAPGLFVESKMVEKLNVTQAMEKAVEQCGGALPILCHRKKRTDWLVTVRLQDLVHLSVMVSTSCTPQAPSDPTSPPAMTSCPPEDLPVQPRLWAEGQ
jgi:Holliday junction resolvase